MACGAALYFDEQTDAAVRGLWQLIEDAGLPSNMLQLNYPPHLSILLCEETDVDGLRDILAEFIVNHPPVSVTFSALGLFPGQGGVIYLAPTVNRELLDFHANLSKLIAPFTTGLDPYYRPDVWVPHVTLDLDVPVDQVGAVVAALNRVDHLPKQGLVKELFLADFPGDQTGIKEQFKARLGSAL